MGLPSLLSGTEKPYGKEKQKQTKKKKNKTEKSQKSLYKDVFFYYMGTLPACQQ